MTRPDENDLTLTALKAAIEAADRAAARGAPGEALRCLLGGRAAGIAPDHDHPCPDCGAAWSHLDEPCGDLTAPIRCGECEAVGAHEQPAEHESMNDDWEPEDRELPDRR